MVLLELSLESESAGRKALERSGSLEVDTPNCELIR